ncbi:putative ankyrin repeat protein RF_0381 [Microplitis mediator]|uniref:putative ankyrin repeat protein RF_0381 n=1 Tax=Microplitis mediator TaxID=375433 RepID=UPI0025565E76|nr:putative ankyrin repeat protein RF_0381 [Microplitis mediator]
MRKSTKQKSRIRQSRLREWKIQKSRIRQYNFVNRFTKLCKLINAIQSQDKDYIDNVTSENFNINSNHLIPIHEAARVGNYEIFLKLIKIGADINKREPITQRTVLHSAAESCNYDIVKYLIENGVDVNAVVENSGSITGETALHFAAKTGGKEVITLLLSNNADINAKSEIGITPIISAVRADNYDAMNALIKYKPDLFCSFKDSGYTKTIFHVAVETKNYTVLLDWLFSFSHWLDVNNNNFCSFFKSQLLLHFALSSDKYDDSIFMCLLNVGVDINALDSNDKLAIEQELKSENNFFPIHMITTHILELIAAGFYVCDRNITAVNNIRGFDDFLAECRLEVKKMKTNMINGSNITFIEVLHKNVRYVAPYLKSDDLKTILFGKISISSEYPIYGNKILFKLWEVMKRVDYIKDSEEVIYNIFYELQLPDTFIRELYYYLSNYDLDEIVQASRQKKK